MPLLRQFLIIYHSKTASEKISPANQQGARCEILRLQRVFYDKILYNNDVYASIESSLLK